MGCELAEALEADDGEEVIEVRRGWKVTKKMQESKNSIQLIKPSKQQVYPTSTHPLTLCNISTILAD